MIEEAFDQLAMFELAAETHDKYAAILSILPICSRNHISLKDLLEVIRKDAKKCGRYATAIMAQQILSDLDGRWFESARTTTISE